MQVELVVFSQDMHMKKNFVEIVLRYATSAYPLYCYIFHFQFLYVKISVKLSTIVKNLIERGKLWLPPVGGV